MNKYQTLIQELETFTEVEQYLHDYYIARNDPKAQSDFLKKHGTEWFYHYFPKQFEHQGDFFEGKTPSTPTLFMEEWPDPPHSIGTIDIFLEKQCRYLPKFPHCHDFFEIIYVLKGECIHIVSGQNHLLKEGELVFIAPGTIHEMEVLDHESIVINIPIRKSTFERVFFNLLRTPGILSRFFLDTLYSDNQLEYLMIHTGQDTEIAQAVLDMLEELKITDYHTNQILVMKFSLFLIQVTRSYGHSYTIPQQSSPKKQHIDEIINYLYEHYQTISLASLAEHFHYSREYCSRLIKQHTGQSFTELLKNTRMGYAQALLKHTTMTIEELSYHVGYESKQSFIHAFHREFHMNPNEYRKQQQKKRVL